MTSITRLLACILIILLPNAIASDKPTTIQIYVADIAEVIEEHYFDAQTGQHIANDLRTEASQGAFDSLINQRDLATTLTEWLQPFDRHFRVNWQSLTNSTQVEEPELSYADSDRRANYGIRRIEILPGNVGYLELSMFTHFTFADSEPPARKAMDAALQLLSGADALIIDLRHNGGGSPVMAGYLISAFTAPDAAIYNTFYHRGGSLSEAPDESHPSPRLDVPLYILTSARTGSAAESFAYTLKHAERAVVVGESSGGAANPGREFEAGHGFNVFVSTGSPVNPITGRNWEGEGVQPDVNSPANHALEITQELALERILEGNLPAAEAVDTRWALEALRTAPALTKTQTSDYSGRYGMVAITAEEGQLVLHRDPRPPLQLSPLEQDLFTIVDDPSQRVRFQRDPDGQIIALELMSSDGAISRYQREAADNAPG